LRRAFERKTAPPDERPELLTRILPRSGPKVVKAVTVALSYDNLHWGERRGRHQDEMYLSIGRHADMFPPRGVRFDVRADTGETFGAKAIGSSRRGDPRPIHLTSSPSNKDLGRWLRSHGAEEGDRVRISRMSDDTYYLEFLRAE